MAFDVIVYGPVQQAQAHLRASERTRDHWLDMASRHQDKCGDCSTERGTGYALGCDKWWRMQERGEKHAEAVARQKAHIYRLRND